MSPLEAVRACLCVSRSNVISGPTTTSVLASVSAYSTPTDIAPSSAALLCCTVCVAIQLIFCWGTVATKSVPLHRGRNACCFCAVPTWLPCIDDGHACLLRRRRPQHHPVPGNAQRASSCCCCESSCAYRHAGEWALGLYFQVKSFFSAVSVTAVHTVPQLMMALLQLAEPGVPNAARNDDVILGRLYEWRGRAYTESLLGACRSQG